MLANRWILIGMYRILSSVTNRNDFKYLLLPLDSFAMMMCFKTMEMEPEIVLLEAFSKWDEKIQGVISLERQVALK